MEQHLETLRQLYLQPAGPVVSVELPAPSAVEDAGERLGRHWKDARRRLEHASAPDALLAVVDGAVAQGHAGGSTLTVLTDGEHTVRAMLPEPTDREVAAVDVLPRGLGLLGTAQRAIPHLVVAVDRTGADIVAEVASGEHDRIAVEGDTLHITRSAPGGWSQRRFQQRAENVWERNAREVADAVARAGEEIGARLVVAAGDVRAIGFLREHLPAVWADRLVVVDEGFDDLPAVAIREARSVAAADTAELLERLGDDPDRAAMGAAATCVALRRGAASTLLVADEPDDQRSAMILDAEPGQVALDPSGLPQTGRRARLVDALVRAALATGAEVRVVPGAAVPDGVAARLRHPLA